MEKAGKSDEKAVAESEKAEGVGRSYERDCYKLGRPVSVHAS